MTRKPAEISETVRRFRADTQALQVQTADAFLQHRDRPELDGYPAIRAALVSASRALQGDAEELELAESDLGSASPHPASRRVLADFTGAVAGRLSAVGAWPATRILRDELVSVAGLISSLTLLHSLSLARSFDGLAAIAARQLQSTTALQVKFNVLLSGLVIAESSRREPIGSVPGAVDRATQQIRHTWTSLSA